MIVVQASVTTGTSTMVGLRAARQTDGCHRTPRSTKRRPTQSNGLSSQNACWDEVSAPNMWRGNCSNSPHHPYSIPTTPTVVA